MHPLRKTAADMFRQGAPEKDARPEVPPSADDYAPISKKHVTEMKAAMAEAPSRNQLAHVAEHFRQKGYNRFDIAHAVTHTRAPAADKQGMAPVLEAQMPKDWAARRDEGERILAERQSAAGREQPTEKIPGSHAERIMAALKPKPPRVQSSE